MNKKIKLKESYLILITTFLIKIVLINLITVKDIRNLNNYISEVHLVIKGKGNQRILYDYFYAEPSEVIVNGISEGNSCKKSCDLDEDINNVVLKFNEQLKSCYLMFYYLENIIEIDLSLFDTSEVTSMISMFESCIDLEKITLGNINTSSVGSMDMLFCDCNILTTIDLSNFDTSNAKSMMYMFSSCTNLKFLDLSNFDTSNVNNIRNMFNNCNSLFYLNLKSFNFVNSIILNSAFDGISSTVKICSNDEKINNILSQKDIYNDCSDKCFKPNIKIDIQNNKCIESCSVSGYQFELNNICYNSCPEGSFLSSEDELVNNNENIKICYDKTPEGYYLDLTYKIYKRKSIVSLVQELLSINNINNNIDIDLETQDKVQEKIKDLMKKGVDTNSVKNGNDIVINVTPVNYTITNTKNQKNNDNNNVSTIDLGECEDKLKEEYNISKNNSLYILKVDLIKEQIHKVEYEVYYPFFPNNLTQLNLSICKDIKIFISIPFDIPKGQIIKYNKSSELYNSICYTSTSKDGTDEPYKDRQDNYKKNNSLKVCEEDCDFSEYDYNKKKAICSCFTKIKFPAISVIKVDKEKMFSNFKNIKNIANIKMLECIYLFLDTKNIIKNSANYMMILLMILSVVSVFSFICYNNVKIKKNINKFCLIKNNLNHHKITSINNNQNKIKPIKRINFKKEKSIFIKNHKEFNTKKPFINRINKKKNLIINNKKSFKSKNLIIRPKNIRQIMKNKKITKSMIKAVHKNRSTKSTNTQLIAKSKIIGNKIQNDNEMNSLNYEEAKAMDRRTYCQYYFSLLRTKHILIFTFLNFRDYNSQSIKIYIFFFTFAINYLVSAMFYSDDTMHKINVDKGSFDITYQLPIMAYSMIISTILNILINNLGLYEDDILSFKKSKNKTIVSRQKLLFKIKCKIFFFFIITYILIFFFWIFLGCFCAVYKNTQIHLLIDVSSSFGLSFISPIFIYLLPGIFRIYSLKGKIKRPYLFKFSKLLQII